MRKFSLQLLGLVIIFVALRLVADRVLAPFVLRDGALLSLAGMVLFAVGALDLWAPPLPSVLYHWTAIGRTLFGAGALTALTGGLLYLLPQAGTMRLALQATLWFLGMGMMLAGTLWHGGVRAYRTPDFRWTVDESGVPVREPLHDPQPAPKSVLRLSPTAIMVLALLVILVGVFLRLWHLTTMPPTCAQAECALGLRLLEPDLPVIQGNPLDPYGWVARFFFALTGDGLLALRLAGAAIGILTLPVFFAAATQVSAAGGALLATLLLALNPWHIAAGRSGESGLVLPLLLGLAFWATLRALHGHRRGWWVLGGLATGALCLSAPELRGAVWLWATFVAALGILSAREDRRSRLAGLSLYAAGVIVASLPAWSLPLALPPLAVGDAGSEMGTRLTAVASFLFQGPAGSASLPVLAAGALTFSLAGMGALTRWWRQPTAGVLLAHLVIFTATLLLWTTDASGGRAMLSLLPGLMLCAAVALDQGMRTFSAAWAPVLRPVAVLAAALTLTLLLAGSSLLMLEETLTGQTQDARNPAYAAMAGYLATALEQPDENAPLIFVPPALFEQPAARLTAGPAFATGLVQPLEDMMALLYADAGPRDLQILSLPDETGVAELLPIILPGATSRVMLDDENRPLYTIHELSANTMAARRGLAGAYFEGDTGGNLLTDRRDGPLTFDWTTPAGLGGPFRVRWSGSLLAPVSGNYHFAVDGVVAPGTEFSLFIDDRVVLDSSLQILEQSEALPRGAHRLTMAYRTTTGAPPPLTVTWTPPNGSTTPIPRQALASPPLPDIGLLGAYFADANFSGPALDLRKDLVVGAPTHDPDVGAVEWQGKLAASRAGEYLLAIVADGDYELILDGRTLLDSRIELPGAPLDAYREALIYLEPGWHDLTVRYVPASPETTLRLLWQPPGGEPALLPATYLLPYTAPLEPGDRPLPIPPALTDAALGDDSFALSRAAAARNPQTVSLSENLAGLPLTPVWQSTGGCGSGDNALNRPHGVAIDAGAERVYVADTANRRVVAYDFDGAVTDRYADERLEEVSDLALASNGALLALDAGTQRIYRIEPGSGRIEPVPLTAGFYRPRGFDMDGGGTLFVADTGGGRVAVLEPGGALLNEYGGPGTALGLGQPVDALATPYGLWAVTSEDGRLWNLYTDASLAAVARAVSIDGPHLAGLDDGSFFLSDPTRQRILRFTAQGRPIQQFSQQGAFALPTGIAAAQAGGEVYLAVVDTQRCTLSLWRTPQTLLR